MKAGWIASALGAIVFAVPAAAQNSPLLLPDSLEKELSAKAANVTEVTLGKNMLAFAAKFMNGKDADEAATRHLVEGLDGIYVRDYEFDKPGAYSQDDVDRVRQAFETPEWSPIVREREKKSGESTDVMMKLVNGESRGMFILSADQKELSIVLILGPIKMDELGKIKGLAGVGNALGGMQSSSRHKEKTKGKEKPDKDKTKPDNDKDKPTKDGGQ